MEKQVEGILRGGQFKHLAERELAGIRQQYDLKRIEIEVLYFLARNKECNTLADIHHYLNANKGHISQALDCLCKRGYLTAEHDKNDRRYVHFFMTDAANELSNQINAAWGKLRDEVFAGISEVDLACFKRVSAQIAQNMNHIFEE